MWRAYWGEVRCLFGLTRTTVATCTQGGNDGEVLSPNGSKYSTPTPTFMLRATLDGVIGTCILEVCRWCCICLLGWYIYLLLVGMIEEFKNGSKTQHDVQVFGGVAMDSSFLVPR